MAASGAADGALHVRRLSVQRGGRNVLRDVNCNELGLEALLNRMPAGLGQTIGETGLRLSRGERARLCIARALLADHDVLILDEPLGALDPQTARQILDVARRRSRALIIITQE